MRAFGSGGRVGPSSLCPTGVLPLLEVIATTGYDLAVVEGGTLTYSHLCGQTRAQFCPDFVVRGWAGRFVIWKG